MTAPSGKASQTSGPASLRTPAFRDSPDRSPLERLGHRAERCLKSVASVCCIGRSFLNQGASASEFLAALTEQASTVTAAEELLDQAPLLWPFNNAPVIAGGIVEASATEASIELARSVMLEVNAAAGAGEEILRQTPTAFLPFAEAVAERLATFGIPDLRILQASVRQEVAKALRCSTAAESHFRQTATAVSEGQQTPTLTFSIGERDFTLAVEGGQPVPLPDDARKVVTLFIQKIQSDSPSENVPFKALHLAIDDEDAGEGKASPRLRQVVFDLNNRIRELAGSPPSGRGYLITTKTQGVHLNPAVRWKLSDKLSSLFRSAYDHPTDTSILAETLPLRGQKLPARSRGRKPGNENDPDD